VAATEASQSAKKVMSERRYGKTRQEFEDALVTSDLAAKSLIFTEYIRWETDQRAKEPNPVLARAVFERAIAMWAQAADLSLASTRAAEKRPKKGKKAKEEVFDFAGEKAKYDAYKSAEAEIWRQYGVWAADASVWERAIRACPASGMLWSHLLTEMVSQARFS
jgi:hypothetical protein